MSQLKLRYSDLLDFSVVLATEGHRSEVVSLHLSPADRDEVVRICETYMHTEAETQP